MPKLKYYRINKTFIAVLFLALTFQSAAWADTWESVGPSGGTFIGSVSDPADADNIIAITSSPSPSKVYRTYDGGASWSQIGEVPYYYLYNMCAYDFSKLYVVSYSRCYYSTDGGVSWSYGSFPASSGGGRSICVDPTDSNNVYVAGYKYDSGTTTYSLAFFSSKNGGKNWTASSFFTFDYLYIYDMAISKTNPDVLYIAGYQRVSGTYYSAMFKSTDGGASWSDISSLVEPNASKYTYSVAIDPMDENRVYAGGHYIYYTTDGGASWTSNTSKYYNVRDIGIDPVDTSNLYLGCSNYVYVSNDYGLTWTGHPDAIQGSWAYVQVAPALPSTIHIATTYSGFYKSTDSGSTWNTAHEGIYAHVIDSIAVAPSEPETVYADCYNCYDMRVSNDSGANWAEVLYPSGCSASIASILVNSMNPNIVMALESSG
ncbi:MAG: WD40/YVTN/BNR-like repeat-containing protein [Planctomycetota bacterium]